MSNTLVTVNLSTCVYYKARPDTEQNLRNIYRTNRSDGQNVSFLASIYKSLKFSRLHKLWTMFEAVCLRLVNLVVSYRQKVQHLYHSRENPPSNPFACERFLTHTIYAIHKSYGKMHFFKSICIFLLFLRFSYLRQILGLNALATLCLPLPNSKSMLVVLSFNIVSANPNKSKFHDIYKFLEIFLLVSVLHIPIHKNFIYIRLLQPVSL